MTDSVRTDNRRYTFILSSSATQVPVTFVWNYKNRTIDAGEDVYGTLPSFQPNYVEVMELLGIQAISNFYHWPRFTDNVDDYDPVWGPMYITGQATANAQPPQSGVNNLDLFFTRANLADGPTNGSLNELLWATGISPTPQFHWHIQQKWTMASGNGGSSIRAPPTLAYTEQSTCSDLRDGAGNGVLIPEPFIIITYMNVFNTGTMLLQDGTALPVVVQTKEICTLPNTVMQVDFKFTYRRKKISAMEYHALLDSRLNQVPHVPPRPGVQAAGSSS